MLIAFGGDFDREWLDGELDREKAADALEALQELAVSDDPVTHQRLLALIDDLHRRERSSGSHDGEGS